MLLQHVQDSIAGYAETAKICTTKLERLFNDLEIPEEEQAADIFAVGMRTEPECRPSQSGAVRPSQLALRFRGELRLEV